MRRSQTGGVLAVLLLLATTACLRTATPLVDRRPLTGPLDAGFALVTDGSIEAIAIKDLDGRVGDACGPLIPRCSMERRVSPTGRSLSQRLTSSYADAEVLLLVAPPGRYAIASVTIYEGSGTRQVLVEPGHGPPVIEVRSGQVTLVGEVSCPGYRWRACSPRWDATTPAKRKVVEIVRSGLGRPTASDADQGELWRSWLPALERAWSRYERD